MKETIQITDPVSRLNRALAEADRLSGYALDTSDPWELVGWLLQHDRLGLAIELQSAARAAKCWEETSVDYPGCDRDRVCVHGNPWGGPCPYCNGENKC